MQVSVRGRQADGDWEATHARRELGGTERQRAQQSFGRQTLGDTGASQPRETRTKLDGQTYVRIVHPLAGGVCLSLRLFVRSTDRISRRRIEIFFKFSAARGTLAPPHPSPERRSQPPVRVLSDSLRSVCRTLCAGLLWSSRRPPPQSARPVRPPRLRLLSARIGVTDRSRHVGPPTMDVPGVHIRESTRGAAVRGQSAEASLSRAGPALVTLLLQAR